MTRCAKSGWPAGLCASRHRLCARPVDNREQIAQALHVLVPQPRLVPRGDDADDRQAAGATAGATLAQDRRLLVSARRHADRCVLADGRTAPGRVAARAGRSALSRTRLEAILAATGGKARLQSLDVYRGVALAVMAAYHLAWDLNY